MCDNLHQPPSQHLVECSPCGNPPLLQYWSLSWLPCYVHACSHTDKNTSQLLTVWLVAKLWWNVSLAKHHFSVSCPFLSLSTWSTRCLLYNCLKHCMMPKSRDFNMLVQFGGPYTTFRFVRNYVLYRWAVQLSKNNTGISSALINSWKWCCHPVFLFV